MLRNHSHYSLLLSTQKPKAIAAKCKSLGYNHAGICDVATISGVVSFVKACKEKEIKPIIGSEIVLKNGSSIALFCKNKDAWNDLLVLISKCNDPENYDNGPKISLEDLISTINTKNFVCVDGYLGSFLCSKMISPEVYGLTYHEIHGSWWAANGTNSYNEIKNHIEYMKSLFSDSYFVEVEQSESESFQVNKFLCKILTDVCLATNCKLIQNTSSYYSERKDAIDHRVILSSKLKTTLKKLQSKIEESLQFDLLKFIRSNEHYIKQVNETDFLDVLSQIEDISILSNPRLPKFECPHNQSENDYLKELCRIGWKKLINTKVDKSKHEEYKNRVLYELQVIQEANLAGYFLIVQDYVNHFRNMGYLIGPGRGSGAGSLVCYLIGITLVDPIPYGLLFERFYNKGRNTKDHVSLPDIDIDFPPSIREDVILYIKNKYGESRVCQMLTFGRLQGRSILKEVLRVNESCSPDQMNKITKDIPDEAEISDQLENMEHPSILMWSLQNIPDKLSAYCWIDDSEKLQGEYAKEFEQAMRLEGVFKSQGKHAAGVVISSEKLDKVCPMIKPSRGDEKIAGMEMADLEAIGCVKFDILGVSLLEKIQMTCKGDGDYE